MPFGKFDGGDLAGAIGQGLSGLAASRRHGEVMMMAADLFEQIGTNESSQMAELIRKDPRKFAELSAMFGGPQQIYEKMQAFALQKQKNARVSAALGQGGSAGPRGAGGSAAIGASASPSGPQSPEDLVRAGLVLLQSGDPEEAAKVFSAAAQMRQIQEPEDAQILMNPKTKQMHAFREGDPTLDALMAQGWIPIRQPGIEATGEAAEGFFGMQKTTAAKVEQELLGNIDLRDKLEAIRSSFDPEFLQYLGKTRAFILDKRLKIGGEESLSEADVDFANRFAAFEQNVTQVMNQYIKSITGAQMSRQEAERILKAIPNIEDNEVKFQAKWKQVMESTTAALVRDMLALESGIADPGDPSRADAIEQWMSLGRVKPFLMTRTVRLATEIKRRNPGVSDDDALLQANDLIRERYGYGPGDF